MARLKYIVFFVFLCVIVASGQAAQPSPADNDAEKLTHGRFENVRILRPHKDIARIVIWLADSSQHAEQTLHDAQVLRNDGALVALVDTASLYTAITKDASPDDDCLFTIGDIENFSRYIQAYYHLTTYRLPILIGSGSGGALSFAVAAEAPEHMLAGVVEDALCPLNIQAHSACGPGVNTASFQIQPAPMFMPLLIAPDPHSQCPVTQTLDFVKSIHNARSIKRSANGDILPGLRAAVRSLGAQPDISLPPPPDDLQGLPIIEVPATAAASHQNADTFAIFTSGDGGWAGIDKNVAERLAAAGIPVVGVDSLRYFWSSRNPDGFAADLDRIARFYVEHWHRSKIIFVGFSQGADVLPAALNRISENTRDRIRLIALMSLGKFADFEFHVSNWVMDDDSGLPIAPEIAKLPIASTICIYGVDDDDTICNTLPPEDHRIALRGDHHFDGDYQTLARIILGQLINIDYRQHQKAPPESTQPNNKSDSH